jgi:hypothetical protein
MWSLFRVWSSFAAKQVGRKYEIVAKAIVEVVPALVAMVRFLVRKDLNMRGYVFLKRI